MRYRFATSSPRTSSIVYDAAHLEDFLHIPASQGIYFYLQYILMLFCYTEYVNKWIGKNACYMGLLIWDFITYNLYSIITSCNNNRWPSVYIGKYPLPF
jgi:hypothetical protein